MFSAENSGSLKYSQVYTYLCVLVQRKYAPNGAVQSRAVPAPLPCLGVRPGIWGVGGAGWEWGTAPSLGSQPSLVELDWGDVLCPNVGASSTRIKAEQG